MTGRETLVQNISDMRRYGRSRWIDPTLLKRQRQDSTHGTEIFDQIKKRKNEANPKPTELGRPKGKTWHQIETLIQGIMQVIPKGVCVHRERCISAETTQ